jgi:SAM-dependent methyltransferase
MHLSSMEKMAAFVATHLHETFDHRKSVLDFGSQNINGSYRSLFPEEKWIYTGLDQEIGDNVDLLVADPHSWKEVEDSSYDVLISGQALEHVEFPWLVFEEIYRVLKPMGLCCIIAPSSGPEHRYPIDCWRFYPDGMRSFCKHAGLKCLEVATEWEPKEYDDNSHQWKDTTLIARKDSV